jgi:hypothetical protein
MRRKMIAGFSPCAEPASFAVNPFHANKPRNPLKTFAKYFFPTLPIISQTSPYLYSVVDGTRRLGRRGFGDLALDGRHRSRRPFFLESFSQRIAPETALQGSRLFVFTGTSHGKEKNK